MAARTHRPYPPDFKAEAVRLATTSGQPLRATAEHLGVSVEALREWVKQGAIDAGEQEGLTTAEREELRRLRRENLVLRQEREILVKVPVPRWGSTADGNRAWCDTGGGTARAA